MRNDWQSKLVLPEWRTSRVSREPRVHLLLFPRERKERERDSLTDLHSYTLDNSTRTLSLLQRSFHLRQLFPRRRRRRRRRRCESRNTSTGNSVAGFSCINDERYPPPSIHRVILPSWQERKDTETRERSFVSGNVRSFARWTERKKRVFALFCVLRGTARGFVARPSFRAIPVNAKWNESDACDFYSWLCRPISRFPHVSSNLSVKESITMSTDTFFRFSTFATRFDTSITKLSEILNSI